MPQPALVQHPPDARDAPGAGADVRLSAEPGVHRHHQHQVHEREDLGDRLHRGRGVQRHARPDAALADLLDRPVQVRTGFHVHGEVVGAGLREGVHVPLRVLDHQVHVDRERGRALRRRRDHGADGDVGDEVPVHHVHVDPVGPALLGLADLLAQAGEVGRKDGGRDQQGAHRPSSRRMTRTPEAPAITAAEAIPRKSPDSTIPGRSASVRSSASGSSIPPPKRQS